MTWYLLLVATLVPGDPAPDLGPPATPPAAETSHLTGDEIRAILNEGRAHHDKKEWDQALAAYDRVLRAAPDQQTALYERAFTLDRSGNPADAVATCERILAREGKSTMAEVYVLLGGSLDALGRMAEAEKVFRDGAEVWPNAQQMHFNLGVNLVLQKKYEEAEEALVRSLALGDKHPGTWVFLRRCAIEREAQLEAYLAAARVATLGSHPKRAEAVRALWDDVMRGVEPHAPKGGSRHGGKALDVTITLPGSDEKSPAAGLLGLSILGANRFLEKNERLSDSEWFAKEGLETAVAMMGELVEDADPRDWRSSVVRYYESAKSAKHVGTIAWFARSEAGAEDARRWVEAHPSEIAAWRKWSDAWTFVPK